MDSVISIEASHLDMGALQPLASRVAQERHRGMGFLTLRTAKPQAPPRTLVRRLRGCAAHADETGLAAVAPAGVGSTLLAMGAAQALLRTIPPATVQRIRYVVHCHMTTNQNIAESVVGRIVHALRIPNAMGLGLSQSGSLAAFEALRLASCMLECEDDLMLVVASDKWLYPFIRVIDDFPPYGDAAAAALVRRGAGGPLEVRVPHLSSVAATRPFWDMDARERDLAAETAMASLLNGFVRSHDPHDIGAVLMGGIGERVFAVTRAAFSGQFGSQVNWVHLQASSSAAEPIRLLDHARAVSMAGGRTTLVVLAGPDGCAALACARANEAVAALRSGMEVQ